MNSTAADPYAGLDPEEFSRFMDEEPEPTPRPEPLWPEPGPLPALLPTAPSLPIEMLPASLRGWLADVADRLQIPLEMAASGVIVGLASVLGRKVIIHPKRFDDWSVFPNLWGAVIARSGSLKTAAMKEAFRPIGRLAVQSHEQYESDAKAFQAKVDLWEAKTSALKREMARIALKSDSKLAEHQSEIQRIQAEKELLQPTERRFRVNDATVAKLHELLAANPGGFLLFRDELSGWLRGLDRAGNEGDRDFYLECWDGDGSYTIDRIGRGSIHAKGLCLSVFGGIQPARLTAYVDEALNGGRGDDGLIQRLQVAVFPDIGEDWKNVDRPPDHEARDRAFSIFQTLASFDPTAAGIQESEFSEFPALRFSRGAQLIFDDWRQKHQRKINSPEITSCPAFESHLAKYPSLIASLALIFHLADWAAQQTDSYRSEVGPIGEGSVRLAADWCDFLELHARKIYAGAIHPDIQAAHAMAAKIREGKVKDKMPMRDIYRAQWSGLGSKTKVVEAEGILSEIGWTRTERMETEHKPVEIIRVNPKIEVKHG